MALLELDGLTRRFGGIIAVDRVTMRVEAGEVRAVIGPNGAGKSTLFNLITGVVKASEGNVRFDGEVLTGQSPHSICRRGISRTFQITALFPEMTARENARLAAQARHARRWQPYGGSTVFGDAEQRGDAALERLGLTHVASRPAGLLSHGDQRLLEVAMALAQQPRLLLLDEPTQGLSVEETAQAVETLAGLLSDGAMTVLLVEHDMEVVFRLARTITVLHRGAVIADGAPEQVRTDPDVQQCLSRRPRLMLTIEGLNTHYGASHVLQGVDLAVPEGRICSVLGRNGVGKTTTLRTIMGLVPPSGGRVVLDQCGHHRLAAASRRACRRRLCAGGSADLSRSYRCGEHPGRGTPAVAVLADAAADGTVPAAARARVEPGRKLSGGEQQMLAIARALVSDPKVMLLDEPSQGLAPLVVRELAEVIRRLPAQGVTILLIEQNMRLAEAVADEIHIMVKGRVVYAASPERFRSEEAEIRSRYLAV